MNSQKRTGEHLKRWGRATRQGFTLIELLVVMLIILLVSAVVLPTVIPAINHRQVSEGARILQGALAGARDTAINTGSPAGIRLLPDPVLNGVNPNTGTLDGTRILAANRYVPIQLSPNYSEGKASVIQDTVALGSPFSQNTYLPYGGAGYTVPPFLVDASPTATNPGWPLMLEQSPVYQDPGTGNWLPNNPTSWFWNIRVGDQVQLQGSSQTYVVVGPVYVSPGNMQAPGNQELFVNVGYPGSEISTIALSRTYPNGQTYSGLDYLLLVNSKDDNNNGYVDEGWDGVDNNWPYEKANNFPFLTDEPLEWELEHWTGSLLNPPVLPSPLAPRHGMLNMSYSIIRRPVVSPGSRETPLPTNIVVDLTTWYPQAFNGTFVSERSRLPVDPITGNVDILLYPNGTVVPTTLYSSPSLFGIGFAFFHFWLAERGDLFDPIAQTGVPYLLPMIAGSANYPNSNDAYNTRALTGERRLMTLYARTGQMVTNQIETFDGTNPSLPFLAPQQGLRGDTR